jgi:hypothetical protein
MAPISYFALLVIAVPVIGLGLLGLILAAASRHTRVAGVTLLAVTGVVLFAGFAVGVYWKLGVPRPERQFSDYGSPREQVSVPFEISDDRVVLPAGDVVLEEPKLPIDVSTEPPPIAAAGGESAGEALPAAAGDAVKSDAATSLWVTTDPHRPNMAELERYLDESEWAAAESAASDADSSLSGHVVPPKRPPWVGVTAFTIDKRDYVPVASGPFATRGECRRALAEAMRQAVAEYVDDHHGREGTAELLGFNNAYIKDHLQHGGVYEETVQASFGPMLEQHSLLEFGKEFRDEIDRRWNQVKVTSRLARVALAALAVLVGLAVVFSYLRLDTATKGYYSGRLQLATGVVILGLVALGVLVARWIPWF